MPTEITREDLKAAAPDGFTLAPTALARPLKSDGSEAMAMRGLLALVNDPSITGPKPGAAELAASLSLHAPSTPSAPVIPLGRAEGEQMPTEHFVDPAVTAAPSEVAHGGMSAKPPESAAEFVVSSAVAPAPHSPMNRIVFTGRSLAGKDWLAAQVGGTVVSMNKLIGMLAFYGFEGGASNDIGHEFIEPVRAWGDGIVSAKFPLTPERWLFIIAVQKLQEDIFPGVETPFGELGFWDHAFEQAMKSVKGRAVVTDCRDENEYKTLIRLGFAPYHVLVSNQTLTARKSAQQEKPANQFSAALDSNVIKQISHQRDGKKLRVIWNDNVPAGSNRFLSVPEFMAKTQSPAVVHEPVSVTIAEEVS